MFHSGAPVAWSTTKRSTIPTSMHRNRKPCKSFFVVSAANGIHRRRVCPTTTIFKVGHWPSSVFDCIVGASQVNLLWSRAPLLGLSVYYIKKQLSWRLFLSRQQDSFCFFFPFKLKFKSTSQVKDAICLNQYFRSFFTYQMILSGIKQVFVQDKHKISKTQG